MKTFVVTLVLHSEEVLIFDNIIAENYAEAAQQKLDSDDDYYYHVDRVIVEDEKTGGERRFFVDSLVEEIQLTEMY